MIHGKKIIDQLERRIQSDMDQRAHMQHLTDITEAWTHGKGARTHVVGHKSRGGPVGPTCQSADQHGRPSGPKLHRLTPSEGSFLALSHGRFQVPKQQKLGARPPLAPSINMRGGKNEASTS